MNTYELRNKYLKVDTTEVTIYRDYPFTMITRELPGNQVALSDETLIQKVLDVLMIEIDPTNYIQNVKVLLDKATEALADTDKTQKIIRGSINEINETLFTLSADVDELKEKLEAGPESTEGAEEHVETTPTVDGDSDDK